MKKRLLKIVLVVMLFNIWLTTFTQKCEMVKNINLNSNLPVSNTLAVNDTLYCIIGYELWKTDGAEDNAIKLATIHSSSLGGCYVGAWGLCNVNNTIFFVGYSSDKGKELWKTDGTISGTTMVKDIYPGSYGSSINDFKNVNGTLFFTAYDGAHGRELWKSDGTEAGTVLVKDIKSGTESTTISNLIDINGTLFFSAYNNSQGSELWKSDGTEAGTVLVKDIKPGTGSSFPNNLTNINGILYFTASNGTNGTELWKSDGTEAGTVMVKDIVSGASSAFNHYDKLAIIGNMLFFTINDGVHGQELWKSDGSEAGTLMVKDINPGASSSNPLNLVDCDGTLFFTANDGVNGKELWKSDGTEAGTIIVKDLSPGSDSSSILGYSKNSINGTLFFMLSKGGTVTELWKSNGIEAGTVKVKQFDSPYYKPDKFVVFNDLLFFTWDDNIHGKELWISNGTEAGTVIVKDILPGSAQSCINKIYQTANNLYFVATDGEGAGLYKSNGSNAGTFLLKKLTNSDYSSQPMHLHSGPGDLLYFIAIDDYKNGYELWKSDGSETGTTMLSVKLGPYPSSCPPAFCKYSIALTNNHVFFISSNYQGIDIYLPNFEAYLGCSDGTQDGTRLMDEIKLNSLRGIQLDNNNVMFFANDGIHGYEPWISDGTDSGTRMVKDINPGSAQSCYNSTENITKVNGYVYFTASDGTQTALWKSNGTESGTVKVCSVSASSFTNVGDFLYFIGYDNVHGRELWKSDGTEGGTVLVKDIIAGEGSTDISNLTNVNGVLFFSANDGVYGRELWKSDGTEGGTVLVKDIKPGGEGSSPGRTFNYKGTLYFSAEGTSGWELWKSDGTEAGTIMVKDINPGSGSSYPQEFAGSDRLYFSASDGVHGRELWETDGTAVGTKMVEDINPGDGSSNPRYMTVVGSKLYFSGSNGVKGNELWKYQISVYPDNGPFAGGSIVTIDSDNLGSGTDITSVTICGVEVASINSQTVNKVVVTVAAGQSPGAGDVVVTSTSQGITTFNNAYTYCPSGVITGVVPDSGPLKGGNHLVIKGLNLGNGSDIVSVKINGVEVHSIISQSSSQVNVITSQGIQAGTGDIVITSTSSGISVLNNGYTYNPGGIINSVTPSVGPYLGGNVVAITGQYLGNGNDITSVSICGVNVKEIRSQSSSQVTVVTDQAQSILKGDVIVNSTSHGETIANNAFTYHPEMKITSVNPASGPMVGQNKIIITGENLGNGSDVLSVKLSGTEVRSIETQSTTELVVVAAPGKQAGLGDVSITSGNYGIFTKVNAYTYNSAGVITETSPSSCLLNGGFQITIKGSNLGNGADITSVTLNGVAVKSIDSQSATEVVVTANNGNAIGTGDVVIKSTSHGTSILKNGFTYEDQGIASISPSSVYYKGGTKITIKGINLGNGSDIDSVLLNGNQATILEQSKSHVIVSSPGGTVATGDVVVNSASLGQSIKKDSFTFSTTLVVPNEATTITEAINMIDANHSILLKSGTYKENIQINKALVLFSNDTSKSVIIQSANPTKDIIEITANNVTVKGLKIQGIGDSTMSSICLNNVENCIVSDNYCGQRSQWGIKLIKSKHIELLDNICEKNNIGIGLYDYSQFNTITGNLCKNNTIGLKVAQGSNYNCLTKNKCSNNSTGISHSDSKNNSLTGNSLAENQFTGCYLYNSQNCIILKNNFYKNSSYGIKLNNTFYNELFLNNFEGNIDQNILSDPSNPSINYWNSQSQFCYRYDKHEYQGFLGNYFLGGINTGAGGIGEEYIISNDNNDKYQLVKESDNYQLNTWFIGRSNISQNDISQKVGTVELKPRENVVWVASVVQEAARSYSAYPWTGRLCFLDKTAGNEKMSIQLGVVNRSSKIFNPIGPRSIITANNHSQYCNFQTNSFFLTVQKGESLAIKLLNEGSSAQTLLLGGAWSYIIQPSDLPAIKTEEVTNVKDTTVTVNGKINNIGASSPSEFGVCWNIVGSPTINDSRLIYSGASHYFQCNISDLKPFMKYYVRAYITNSYGTVYSNELFFTTKKKPAIKTLAVSDIVQTEATAKGMLIDFGVAKVSSVGFCWNTAGNPTINDNIILNSNIDTSGEFHNKISNLKNGTIYYLKSFATNEVGTVYGNELMFSTLQEHFTIQASSTGPGRISPAGQINVTKGNSQAFTFSAYSEAQLATLLVDGKSIAIVDTYTFSNIISNHSIKAVFKVVKQKASLTINSEPESFGSTMPHASTYVFENNQYVSISAHPKEGYSFVAWKQHGHSDINDFLSPQTHVQLNGDTVLTAVFSETISETVDLALLSVPSEGGGTVPVRSVKVPKGVSYSIKAIPAEGYSFVTWLKSSNIIIEENTSTDTSVILSGNASLKAVFRKNSIEVSDISVDELSIKIQGKDNKDRILVDLQLADFFEFNQDPGTMQLMIDNWALKIPAINEWQSKKGSLCYKNVNENGSIKIIFDLATKKMKFSIRRVALAGFFTPDDGLDIYLVIGDDIYNTHINVEEKSSWNSVKTGRKQKRISGFICRAEDGKIGKYYFSIQGSSIKNPPDDFSESITPSVSIEDYMWDFSDSILRTSKKQKYTYFIKEKHLKSQLIMDFKKNKWSFKSTGENINDKMFFPQNKSLQTILRLEDKDINKFWNSVNNTPIHFKSSIYYTKPKVDRKKKE